MDGQNSRELKFLDMFFCQLWLHITCATLRGRIKEAARTPSCLRTVALNRCEGCCGACFNWVWTVQLTQHSLYMDSAGHSYMTRNPCTKHQDKEKSGLRTPRTALCKFVGGALQRTFEHTFVSTTASHSEQQRFKYAWTSNVVNAWPRNSRVHACELR